jgi:hypothetical protein
MLSGIGDAKQLLSMKSWIASRSLHRAGHFGPNPLARNDGVSRR